ncbi:MAG: hypothetical protein M5R36_11400 [Deltaproteobacteria bacterium]|nr:hypothetical protein [Deltaproteobacteria bacterium]
MVAVTATSTTDPSVTSLARASITNGSEAFSIPTERISYAAAAVGSKIYLLGGQDADGETDLPVLVYNTVAKSWNAGANVPDTVLDGDACAVDGLVYLPGGWVGAGKVLGEMLIYDPAADTWSKGPQLAAPRDSYAAFCDADAMRVHVAGGIDTAGNVLADHWIYDIAGATWSAGAPAPSAFFGAPGVSMDGGGLVVGGADDLVQPRTTILRYDFAGGTWSTAGSVLHDVLYTGAADADGLIVQMGGATPSVTAEWGLVPTKQTQIFDTAAGGTALPGPSLRFARPFAKAVTVGSRVYVFGGAASPDTAEKILMP